MRKIESICVLLICIIVMLSCTSTYSESGRVQTKTLARGANIAIAACEDGVYGSKVYKDSGFVLARKIQDTLRPYTTNTEVIRDYRTIREFTADDLLKYDYVIIPTILQWEDRVTSWSGIADKVTFAIDIYDRDGTLIQSATLSGRGPNLTFGNAHVGQLLDEPLEGFFKQSF